MIHGDSPYGEETPAAEKMELIKSNQQIDYDQGLSSEVVDLVKKILVPNPEERLSLDQIFQHEWMKKFEQSYGLNIDSFLEQNSREAESKEANENLSSDEEENNTESPFNEQTEANQKGVDSQTGRQLYRDKETINFGEPDGELKFIW